MIATLIAIAAAICTVCLAMGIFSDRKGFQVKGRTVIVTGGSQGLGLSLAKQLGAKGAKVVVVARNIPKLEAALKEIDTASQHAGKHLYLSYDLRSPESATRIIEEVTRWNAGCPPDILINCAGNCQPGFFASSSIEQQRLQMDTVYWTCAYMSHAVLQEWIKPSSKISQTRHIVFISSVVALFPMAGYAPYNPAKAAMRSLADTLNQEVAVYNGARMNQNEKGPAAEIKVHIAFPMGIDSPGYENEQKTKPKLTQLLEESDKPQDPEELAKILLAGLESGQYTLTSALIGHIMRGWAMGASQRTNILDYFWSWLGSIVVLFVVPDFIAKCKNWGKEKGLSAAR